MEDELKETADGRRRIELTQYRLARHGAAREHEDAQGKEEMDMPDMMDAPRSPAWEDVPGGDVAAPRTPPHKIFLFLTHRCCNLRQMLTTSIQRTRPRRPRARMQENLKTSRWASSSGFWPRRSRRR